MLTLRYWVLFEPGPHKETPPPPKTTWFGSSECASLFLNAPVKTRTSAIKQMLFLTINSTHRNSSSHMTDWQKTETHGKTVCLVQKMQRYSIITAVWSSTRIDPLIRGLIMLLRSTQHHQRYETIASPLCGRNSDLRLLFFW